MATFAERRFLVVLFSIMLAGVDARGAVKYGSPSDLRGAKTFYVDAGEDVGARNGLVQRIESKTSLKIVDDVGHADVIVSWTSLSKKCAKAAVLRVAGEEVKAVWNWKDCAGGFVSPEFLFVRKFANLIDENR